MRRWRFWFIGVAVTLLAVYFILGQIDLTELWRAFSTARYGFVIPAFLLLSIGLWTRALRWRALLDDALPLGRAFPILNVSYLVNGILPLRLGEVARAYLAQRANRDVPFARALSTIVVERLLDLLAVFMLIALAASAALPSQLRAAAFSLAPLALVALIGLVWLAARRDWTLRRVDQAGKWLPERLRLPLHHLARDILVGVMPLTHRTLFLRIVGWTVVSWALSVAAGYVLMLAFWPEASWAATSLLIAAASLAIAVPAVPGSVGPFEASVLLALAAFGYGEPPETATAYAIVVHGVNLLLYALAGGLGLLQEGISLAQLSQGAREIGKTEA
jgi:hypothetical protein